MGKLLRIAAFCLLFPPLPAGAETWPLATLHWPPFTGDMPEGGAMTRVVREAYRLSGDDLAVNVVPWKRAISLVSVAGSHLGFYPAALPECQQAAGRVSQPIGHYRFALAQRRRHPVAWKTPDDLANLRIGVVSGYDNGPLIEDLIRRNRLRPDVAQTDELNLLKLQAGRLDGAVVDMVQFSWLARRLNRDAVARGHAELVLNDQPLAPKTPLYACFAATAAGDRARAALDTGLARLNPDRMVSDYVEALTAGGPPMN